MKRRSRGMLAGMQTWYAGLMIGFAVCALSACDASRISAWFGTKPPYPVQSTGLVFGMRMSLTPIYWIDNDRALFPGYAVEHGKDADGKDVMHGTPPGVYIWDTRSNTYTRHAGLSDPEWSFCFNKGFIAYSIGSNGKDEYGTKFILKAGMLGQEKQLRTDIDWFKNPELGQCDEPQAEVRPEHIGGGIDFLRAADGYLYAGAIDKSAGHFTINADNQDTPIKFYKTGRTEPIILPILPRETFQVEKFSEYGQKYLIIPSIPKSWDINRGGAWPEGTQKPIYELSPDGTVKTIMVPPGLWQNMGDAYITARGIFIISNSTINGNSSTAGGWLLRDGKIVKLFDQLVDGAGVSPDGCKIAYANNDFNPKTTEYVQIIDLCKQ